MTNNYETAYPRIRSEITKKELDDIYTPTKKEISFVQNNARQSAARYFLLLQLKVVQRVGYFMLLSDVPRAVIDHIGNTINARRVTKKRLKQYHRSGACQRHIKLIRKFLNLNEFDSSGKKLM